MAEETSMSDILSDAPPPEAPPSEPPADAPPPEQRQEYSSRKREHQEKEFAAQGLVRDPATGQFRKVDAQPPEPPPEAPKAAEPPAPVPAPAAPQQDMTPKERAAFAAAADERRKRQELEARLKAYEAQKPAEPPKPFWQDPEGALKRQQEETQAAVLGVRLSTAETIARSRHPDFDDKIGVFKEMAMRQPFLAQQMLSAPDPAEFAYGMAKNQMELEQVGGLDAMRKKIEEETTAKVRAQLEAEFKAKAETEAATRAALPGSLSGVRGTVQNKSVWSGPPSMDDILGGK